MRFRSKIVDSTPQVDTGWRSTAGQPPETVFCLPSPLAVEKRSGSLVWTKKETPPTAMDGKKSEEPQWTTARINMAYNPDTVCSLPFRVRRFAAVLTVGAITKRRVRYLMNGRSPVTWCLHYIFFVLWVHLEITRCLWIVDNSSNRNVARVFLSSPFDFRSKTDRNLHKLKFNWCLPWIWFSLFYLKPKSGSKSSKEISYKNWVAISPSFFCLNFNKAVGGRRES